MTRMKATSANLRSASRPAPAGHPLAPPAPLRELSKPTESGRSSPRFNRRGMAAKEILLVTCVVASGGLGLTFVERLANPLPDWHRATSASQRELLIQQAVPVTDEFDCLVTVDRFSGTSPLSQPFHVSHLQFVRRPAADLTVWLLEVSTNELDGWPDLAACSEWALVQAGSPGDAVNAAGGDRTQQSDPTG